MASFAFMRFCDEWKGSIMCEFRGAALDSASSQQQSPTPSDPEVTPKTSDILKVPNPGREMVYKKCHMCKGFSGHSPCQEHRTSVICPTCNFCDAPEIGDKTKCKPIPKAAIFSFNISANNPSPSPAHITTAPAATFEVDKDVNERWKTLIAPYLNTPIVDPWTDHILRDCRTKLSGLDPNNGLGVLHGLLLASDESDLLRQLLEMGLDANTKFYGFEDDQQQVSYDGSDSKEKPMPPRGSTPLHIAALYTRTECFKALLNAGVDAESLTSDGISASTLAQDPSMKSFLDDVAKNGPKSFAQLAHEGLWYAIRYRVRTGKVTDADLSQTFGGKTAAEWIWTKMTKWNFLSKNLQEKDTLTPFKVMQELQYRYGDKVDISTTIPAGSPRLSLNENSAKPSEENNRSHDDDLVRAGEMTKMFENLYEVIQSGLNSVRTDLEAMSEKIDGRYKGAQGIPDCFRSY